ncbi:hypothetical protein IOK49_03570 [Fervidicoccus fontis]|uniref:Amidophosphoribosyltransferase n=1 Tax=Fervidicoccus fontis TaxID=683846 RepID=A0A843A778_9CREN|nr:hypothetical protein [Fervidicoccus fontis]MBE9391158.1 hypothetical protein [Fervidicoccus fontis]
MPLGFLGLVAFENDWDIFPYASYGLLALQHRGGERQIICGDFKGSLKCMNLNEYESDKNEIKMSFIAATMNGTSGSIEEVQLDGEKIIAISEYEKDTLRDLLSEIIKLKDEKVTKLKKLIDEYSEHEVPSFMAITNRNEVIVWRSPNGITPLSIGNYGFDMVLFSSETSAIDVLDCDFRKHLIPGEVAYASPKIFKIFKGKNSKEKGSICLFELLYTARHDSIIDGVPVYDFRKELGKELALNFSHDVDIVVGVPETAYPYAIGFSQAIRKPFELSFIPTAGRMRSMLKASGIERLIAVHLKMNPVKSAMEGKRIALIDDSMVTGSTIKTVSQILRNRVGVEEIHLLIASPKIVSSCPYRIFPLEERNLIASNLEDTNITRYLDVDSLTWLSNESVKKVADKYGISFCDRCFNKNSEVL